MRTHTFTNGVLLTLLILAGVLVPDVVQAADQPVAGGLGETIVKFAGVLAAINTFLHILLLTILKMLGYLMQADFFNDAQMMSALNMVWVLSRDIMNIAFALALIGVAFYTIITAKTELIKSKFTHFVIAVILVNFSWFFPRVIIDVANVLTATIYSIPSTLPGFTCIQVDENGAQVPCDVVMDAGFFLSPAGQQAFCNKYGYTAGDLQHCPCVSGLGCYAVDTWDVAVNSMRPAHRMINGLAVSFAKVTQYAKIPTTLRGDPANVDASKVTLQVVMGILMAFIVQIAIVLPLIGLGVGLFLRILIMWVCVAFMPFTFIGYIKDGKLGTAVFGFETDVWKEFITAAFLPAVVAVPISIGFIMLSTAATIPAPNGVDVFFVPLIPGVQGWWPMLWIFAAVGIIWVGSFTALRTSKIVGGVTDKIQGFGKQAFGTAAKLPLLTPLPLPGLGVDTVGDIFSKAREFRDDVNFTTRRGGGVKELLAAMGSRNNQAGPGPKTAPEIATAMTENQILQDRVIDKLQQLKEAAGKTNNEKIQIVQSLRTQLNMPESMELSKVADEILKLKNENNVDQRVKTSIDDVKGMLEGMRDKTIVPDENPPAN